MSSSVDRQKLLIEMVMRQTQYTYEEAAEKLEACNNDYMTVIRGSMGINKVEDKTVTSINQHVYKEIRGLMDVAASDYRRKKEMEQKRAEFIEKLREEYNRRQEASKSTMLPIEEGNGEEGNGEEGNGEEGNEVVSRINESLLVE